MSRSAFDPERNVYSAALAVARVNWAPCALATLLLVLTDLGTSFLYAPLAFAVLRALILMIVGYSAYRTLLSAGAIRGLGAAATPEGRVPWRYAGLMLMILGPILFLGIVWTSPHANIGQGNLADILLGLVMVMIYASLYVLLGTALPEVVERGDVSLRRAVERGRARYREIARSLVFGPWLFRAASLVVMMGLSALGADLEPYSVDARAFSPVGLAPLIAFKASHVFAEVMTAVVLVRAYLRAERAPRVEADSGTAAAEPVSG